MNNQLNKLLGYQEKSNIEWEKFQNELREKKCRICERRGHATDECPEAFMNQPECALCGETGHHWNTCGTDNKQTDEGLELINKLELAERQRFVWISKMKEIGWFSFFISANARSEYMRYRTQIESQEKEIRLILAQLKKLKKYESFTAFYCLTHDQGFLVKGDFETLPEAVRPCGAYPFRACDSIVLGGLEVEGNEARALDFDMDFDYDIYGGGWERSYFVQEVYLHTGEKIDAPPALNDLFLSNASLESVRAEPTQDKKDLINEFNNAINLCNNSIATLERRTKQFEFFKKWDNERIDSKELKKKWMKSNQGVLDDLSSRKKEFQEQRQQLEKNLERLKK